MKDPFDSTNFDDFSAIENEKDIGAALTAEEQKVFESFWILGILAAAKEEKN